MTQYEQKEAIKRHLLRASKFIEQALKDIDRFDYTDEELYKISCQAFRTCSKASDVGILLDKGDHMARLGIKD